MEKYSGLYGSKNNKIIDIIPFSDEYNIHLNSNTVMINGIDNMNNSQYLPNGTYHFSASSTASLDKQPYMAFDNSLNSFWQCDFSGNTDKTINKTYTSYKQNPYNTVSYDHTISPYVGGGDDTNTWTTVINGNQINGEWLQVQLPSSVYLYTYDILTPTGASSPFLFAVVGSKDGVEWSYIDQQTTANDNVKNNTMSYNVNSTQKFYYYRLIITEIIGNNPYIQILKWKLKGGTHLNVMLNNEPTTHTTSITQYVSDSSSSGPTSSTPLNTTRTTHTTATTSTTATTTQQPTRNPTLRNTIAITTPPRIETFTSLSRSMETTKSNGGYMLSSNDNKPVAYPLNTEIITVRDDIEDRNDIDLGYNSNICITSSIDDDTLYNDDPIIYISITLGVITISLYMLYLTKNK